MDSGSRPLCGPFDGLTTCLAGMTAGYATKVRLTTIDNLGLIGKLVRSRPASREVFGEHRVDRVDSGDRAVLETSFPERRLHGAANRLPCCVADPSVDAAIGDDLHGLVGKKYVNEHADILFGVPDAQAAEHIERMPARFLIAKHEQ